MPKELDEEAFWRSYFFRVNMLKRAFGVSEAPALIDGAQLPEKQKMRSSLANSASSLGGRESVPDLSSSTSSTALPGIDEFNLSDGSDDSDGLVGESDEETIDPRSLALDFDALDASPPDEPVSSGFYEIEKDGTYRLPCGA